MSANSDVILSLYDAFARGDVPTVLAGLDADVSWTEAEGFPYHGTYHGPDAVLNGVFVRLGAEWVGFKVLPQEHIDGGDKIVSCGRYSGTFKATGKSFDAAFAHVWTLRGGKVVGFYQYVDTAIVQAAMQP